MLCGKESMGEIPRSFIRDNHPLQKKEAMTRDEIRNICDGRLSKWKEILVNNMSTPVILIGVGHERNAGQIHLVTVENVTEEEIEKFLVNAWWELIIKK